MVIKNQTEKGEKIIKHKAKSKKGKKNFDKKGNKRGAEDQSFDT
jgi:hypothetical protein